ncbi:putative PGG domain-containing protein [Helianthus annuus]|nr:putative PGG domain-containing protein [Helianthus annuus]
MLPPPCRVVENAEGKTPQELFIENHKDLVFDGMKSLIDSINISLMVAVLISTIGFSVVYAIPGGFDQNNGHPMLLRRNYFIAFVVLDVISFIFSTTLIISFLSIILSLHHPHMGKIVVSWTFGIALLTYSILCISVAFILSLFLLYLKRSWMYIFYVPGYLLLGVFLGRLFMLIED